MGSERGWTEEGRGPCNEWAVSAEQLEDCVSHGVGCVKKRWRDACIPKACCRQQSCLKKNAGWPVSEAVNTCALRLQLDGRLGSSFASRADTKHVRFRPRLELQKGWQEKKRTLHTPHLSGQSQSLKVAGW